MTAVKFHSHKNSDYFLAQIKFRYFPPAQTLACGIKTYVPGGMIDFQNIETGSPFMSGTLRNKLFVGRHSR